MLVLMTLATEPAVLRSMRWNYKNTTALAVSCAAGVAMSYFAFLCRSAVSATSFTVIGNVCKILTVLINISIWDKHASPLGLAALLLWCADCPLLRALLRARPLLLATLTHPDILDGVCRRAPLTGAFSEPLRAAASPPLGHTSSRRCERIRLRRPRWSKLRSDLWVATWRQTQNPIR